MPKKLVDFAYSGKVGIEGDRLLLAEYGFSSLDDLLLRELVAGARPGYFWRGFADIRAQFFEEPAGKEKP